MPFTRQDGSENPPWTIGRLGAVATSRRPTGWCPGLIPTKCAGPLKPPARRHASAGCNVSQVGTLNQSGTRPAVRRCPRRAVARAEQAGDNRMPGITMNAPSAPVTAIARQPYAADAGLVDPVAHQSPTRTRSLMTTSASVLPDGGFVSQPWPGRTTRLASRRPRSSVAVITARGDIDASNADTLTEYTLGHLMGCRGLILDLRGLDFFGTEGFAALHRVSVCCARARICWAVVPGEAVCRMLRIGDPHGLLPAAGTVQAAMSAVGDQPRRRPRRPDRTASAASRLQLQAQQR
jgi:anti-anti-sigma factor